MITADDSLIQIALEHGLLEPATLAAARQKLAAVPSHAVRPGLVEQLVADGALDPTALNQAITAELGLPCVVLGSQPIPADVLAAVPAEFVREHHVLPFDRENGALRVAVADPLAIDVTDALSYHLAERIELYLASREDLSRAIAQCHGYDDDGDELFSVSTDATFAPPPVTAPADDPAGQTSKEDAPIIRLVHRILHEGIRRHASDIHLEPLERRFRVRYRIDGVLIEAEAPPKSLQLAIISRLKIMANISIAEKRVPQDGRTQITLDGKTFDLRVSSLPTAHGESIVMRVLDQAGLKLEMPELGFLPDDQAHFEQMIAAAHGMMLVTGPTGSGKTTTLYASLHHLNRPDRKIITVEEPVEYQLAGINQVPVNSATGMTFAAALRAMLRQAPNIVMVGEIRDTETAEIAINASLTGHLVFSTLHTNDAPSAVTRLIDIGAKPFLVAAALRSVMAQRLVRKICPHCKRAHTPAPRELHALQLTPVQLAGATFAHGAGCSKCHGTGYAGRLGIFEIFTINDAVRSLIYENVSTSHLRQQARLDGMRTMREDGLRKVLAGMTTIEEVVSATVGDET